MPQHESNVHETGVLSHRCLSGQWQQVTSNLMLESVKVINMPSTSLRNFPADERCHFARWSSSNG